MLHTHSNSVTGRATGRGARQLLATARPVAAWRHLQPQEDPVPHATLSPGGSWRPWQISSVCCAPHGTVKKEASTERSRRAMLRPLRISAVDSRLRISARDNQTLVDNGKAGWPRQSRRVPFDLTNTGLSWDGGKKSTGTCSPSNCRSAGQAYEHLLTRSCRKLTFACYPLRWIR